MISDKLVDKLEPCFNNIGKMLSNATLEAVNSLEKHFNNEIALQNEEITRLKREIDKLKERIEDAR